MYAESFTWTTDYTDPQVLPTDQKLNYKTPIWTLSFKSWIRKQGVGKTKKQIKDKKERKRKENDYMILNNQTFIQTVDISLLAS